MHARKRLLRLHQTIFHKLVLFLVKPIVFNIPISVSEQLHTAKANTLTFTKPHFLNHPTNTRELNERTRWRSRTIL